jgi:hypothetical protein
MVSIQNRDESSFYFDASMSAKGRTIEGQILTLKGLTQEELQASKKTGFIKLPYTMPNLLYSANRKKLLFESQHHSQKSRSIIKSGRAWG